MTPAVADHAVAASGTWHEDDAGARLPGGEIHAWMPGRNETLCGLSLHRSQLRRFPHVPWAEALPESGGLADGVRRVCPKCRAAAAPRPRRARSRRPRPRP